MSAPRLALPALSVNHWPAVAAWPAAAGAPDSNVSIDSSATGAEWRWPPDSNATNVSSVTGAATHLVQGDGDASNVGSATLARAQPAAGDGAGTTEAVRGSQPKAQRANANAPGQVDDRGRRVAGAYQSSA